MQDSKNDITLSSNTTTQDKDELDIDFIDLKDSNKEQINTESMQADSIKDNVENIESLSLETQETNILENTKNTESNPNVLHDSDVYIANANFMQSSTHILENQEILESNTLNGDNEISQDIKDSDTQFLPNDPTQSDSISHTQQEYDEERESKTSDIDETQNTLDSIELANEANVPDEIKDEILESNAIQKPRDSHTSQEMKQESIKENREEIHTEELNKEDLFDNIILQKSHNEVKPKKYRWQYLVYSKRVFISLVCIAFVVSSYAVYLFFGSTSLEVLWDLHKTRNALRLEVEQSRLDNATLQRDVLELRALEPK